MTRLPTLEGYVELVWANLAVIIVTTLAGGVIGYLGQRGTAPTYRVSASVELPDVPTWVDVDPEDPIPDRTTIDTSSQLLFTPPVFRAASEATGLPAVRIDEHLSVSAYPLSRVLIVTFEGDSRDQAEAGAVAAADAFVQERATSLAGDQVEGLSDLQRSLQQSLRRLKQDDAEFTTTGQRIKAQLAQVQRLQQDSGGNGGTVIDYSDPKVVDKHPELQVVTGLVLGLLASIIYSWWRPRRLGERRRAIPLPAVVARPVRRIGRRLSPLFARRRPRSPSSPAVDQAVARLRRGTRPPSPAPARSHSTQSG
jgi:hypothetical protein